MGAGNGLQGEYFNNTGLVGTPVLTRTDTTVNFNWGDSGPGHGIAHNRFSVRWTGQVEAAAAGAYTFSTVSDDGIRVWVNNAKIIDHWTSHTQAKDVSTPVNLVAGQKYDIKIEYYEDIGKAIAKLHWTPPGLAEIVVPETALFSTPVPPGTSLEPVYVSTLHPTFVLNGLGPYQRNRSNGGSAANDGKPITLDAVKFARGLGVHAASELRYGLAGRYLTFYSEIGIDDEVGTKGSAQFEVWLDGTKAYSSGVMLGADKTKIIKLDVKGKNELKLIVSDGGDGINSDHGDWADAHLIADPTAPGVPNPPSGITATPGDKQVVLAWKAVTGATSYAVFRGTAANGEAAVPVAMPKTPTATDAGLTNGTQYFYKITALNAAGSSVMSNEAHATPNVVITTGPTGLKAVPGDKQIVLTWNAVSGAASYNLYRSATAGAEGTTAFKTGIAAATFTDTGLTNGTPMFYKVAAVTGGVAGGQSGEATATPIASVTLTPAPTGLTAVPGDKQIILTWNAVTGATNYNVYRGAAAGAEAASPIMTGVNGTTFTNTGLTNGTDYFYKVAAVVNSVVGEKSSEATAKPVAPALPTPPTNLTAVPGDKQNVLTWTAVTGATSYNVYRGTATGAESNTALATGITAVTFTDAGLTNGTTYYYKVATVAPSGTSLKSTEAFAAPTAPGLLLTQAQKDAFRFLRQATFGPTPALVDHVVQVGKSAFLDEQFALAPTAYPDALITMPNMELVSEQFFNNAITGPDQLRQRVGWALSQIFVTSAVKVDNTHAMVPYIRMLENNAFGNVKTVMNDVALSPAMGEFLDMVNNKKVDPGTGALPNENFAREWLQLFSIGLVELNDNGTPTLTNGVATPTFSQSTVADMARALTGWTYGDKVAGNPTKTNPAFYDGPMEPVDKFHDVGAKTVLGTNFPAGQTTQQDFDQALSVVFNHHNTGPFLVRELIQRLVTSNPSPTYISDVVAIFNNNGQGVRGDLKAVVKAILLHPEASSTGSKFSEPALFLTTLCRVICTNIVDHPFLTDYSQDLSQRIWFAPSVFNYFSPNYKVAGGAFFAPELQIWSTATAMTRTNFIASLISGGFGSNVTLNLAPLTAVAADPNALTDTANALIMGGTMSAQQRQAILAALTAAKTNEERVRTVLYLTAGSMQYQAEH